MLLRYADGDSVREFQFNPGKLTSPEAEAIEDVGGDRWDTFDRWGELFMSNNRKALRAALWIMLKRENPALKFNSVVVTADAITWDFDQDEQVKIREAIANEPDIDPEQRAELLRKLSQFPVGKDQGSVSGNSDMSTDSESAQS